LRFDEYFIKLTSGDNHSPADRIILNLLRIISFGYAALMWARAVAYRLSIFRSCRLPRPVISVGNVTVGGTGKTPVTAWIAAYLLTGGKKVAVLSRGYGGSLEGTVAVVSDGVKRILTPLEAGDEPCLLADNLPGLVVVIGSSRYEAGLLAMERFQPDIFILDDGFQHLNLRRDLNILLLDAKKPFGNGFVFPAGLLREPVGAINRADLVVFTRADRSAGTVERIPANLPVISCEHGLSGYRPYSGGDIRSFEKLEGLKGLAFAGIADPNQFFDSLEKCGVQLVATIAFPDHTDYGDDEIAALAKLKRSSSADYLITTSKDAVKMPVNQVSGFPFYVAELEVVFHGETMLKAALDNIFKQG
jgi:tetraacyldisaccharide 4'-kinase